MVTTGSFRRWMTLCAAALPAAAILVAGTTDPVVAAGADPTPVYLDTHYSFAERAADLVSRMTLPEKVGQLHTNNAPPIPRLGVQQYTYWSEGQHGINRLGANTNNGGAGDGVHATSFPTNLASTMSWDPSLIYQETTAISDEIRGELDKSLWGVGQNNIGPDQNGYGSLTYWAPTVNLDRDPRWGRTDEAFGEDPYLVGRMAGAYVNGYQGQTLDGDPTSRYLKVAATAKHFALNNVEQTRNSGSSNTSDTNIRDYYTAQFRSLIEDSHVSGLMTSYNAVNGTPSPANTYTTNELAQRTWGFGGYVTSDCGAVGDVWSPNSHNWAPPGWTTSTSNGRVIWTNTATGRQLPAQAGGQAYALRAGTDVNCTGDDATLSNIQAAVDAGVLSEGVVDEALVQLFTVRMQTGEFDSASKVRYTQITKDQIQSPAHQALAEKVAANSLVLLKNEPVAGTATLLPAGGTTLLPADPAGLHHVVIVGDLAGTVTLGGYSGDPSTRVSAVQGITSAVQAASPDATVTFDACATSTIATTPAACSAETQAAIKAADLVVVFAGTDDRTAGEASDRRDIGMPGNYLSLIQQVKDLGNPRTVLAMQTDGPVAVEGVRGDFPAIVYSAYNGQSQGTALADVLFGKQNPSGHLNFTWYKDDSQLPAIENYGLNPAETGGLGRTYQYFTGTPSYPFGFGLSYSDFAYSKVRTTPAKTTADGTVTVHFSVTNTRARAGATVAQVYVSSPAVAGRQLPVKRLAGFAKTAVLKPGQTQAFAVPVHISDLAFWDEQSKKDVVYPGGYQFQVSTDAAHVAGSTTVAVTGTIKPKVKHVTVQPGQVVFAPGDTLDLTGRNPWIADDTAQAGHHRPADGIVEAANNDQSFADLSKVRVAYHSSNPRIATVTRAGVVTARSNGTATISATVGGVTGSAPVVVRSPFTLSAPPIVQPGADFTVTTTVPHPAGAPRLRDVSLTLSAPEGWTATATSPSTFPSVPPGQTISTSWKVSVPAGAAPTENDLTAQASFTDDTGPHALVTTARVSLPYPSLAAAYNNTGISDDADPAAASFDGGALSFSGQALATGTPALIPGASVTHDGQTFTWPDVQPGRPDNVVAGGQTVAVSGSGSTMALVGAANNGTSSGAGTIVYTDGTRQPYDVAFSDWWANSPAQGSDILTTVPYLNSTGGRNTRPVSLYYAAVPLQTDKVVKYVTLPDVSRGPVSGLAMHIFAVAINRLPLTLTAPAIAQPGETFTVTTSLPNPAGSAGLTGVDVTLNAPSGWTVQATSPASFPSLPAGTPAKTTWDVTVPAVADPNGYELTADVTFTDAGGAGRATAVSAVSLPHASLAAAYDNAGISADTDPAAGSLDGGGYSLSAQALAAGTPSLTAGSSFTHDGLTFTWPDTQPGAPDNVVAGGQTFPIPGSGSELAIIGTGTYGNTEGTAVITYTDGSTQPFTLSFNDWWNNAPTGGGDILTTVPYLNGGNGPVTNRVSLYSASVPLATGKTVRYLTLPSISHGAHSGQPAMHVFATAIGR
jgi:beta-glucosidase